MEAAEQVYGRSLSIHGWIALQTEREASRSGWDRWLPIWKRVFGGTTPSSQEEIAELEAVHRWCVSNLTDQAAIERHGLVFGQSDQLEFLGKKRLQWLNQQGQRTLWQAFWHWWRGETLEEVDKKVNLLCSIMKVIHQANDIFINKAFWEERIEYDKDLPEYYWAGKQHPTAADFDSRELGCRSFLISKEEGQVWWLHRKELDLEGAVQVRSYSGSHGRFSYDWLIFCCSLPSLREIDRWNSSWKENHTPWEVVCLAYGNKGEAVRIASAEPRNIHTFFYSAEANELYFNGLTQRDEAIELYLFNGFTQRVNRHLGGFCPALARVFLLAEFNARIGAVNGSIDTLRLNSFSPGLWRLNETIIPYDPSRPALRYVHRVDDPIQQGIDEVRQIDEELKEHVANWIRDCLRTELARWEEGRSFEIHFLDRWDHCQIQFSGGEEWTVTLPSNLYHAGEWADAKALLQKRMADEMEQKLQDREKEWVSIFKLHLEQLRDPPSFLPCLVWQEPPSSREKSDFSTSFIQETSGVKRLKLLASFGGEPDNRSFGIFFRDPEQEVWELVGSLRGRLLVPLGSISLVMSQFCQMVEASFSYSQVRWNDWWKSVAEGQAREQFEKASIDLYFIDELPTEPAMRGVRPSVYWVRGPRVSPSGLLEEGTWHYVPSIYSDRDTREDRPASVEQQAIATYAQEIAREDVESSESGILQQLKKSFERASHLLSWIGDGCIVYAAPGFEEKLLWNKESGVCAFDSAQVRRQACDRLIVEQQMEWMRRQLPTELKNEVTEEKLRCLWLIRQGASDSELLHPDLDPAAWEEIADKVRKECYRSSNRPPPVDRAEKWIRETIDGMHRPNLGWEPPPLEGDLREKATVVVEKEGKEQRYLRFWLSFEGTGNEKGLQLSWYMSSGEVRHSWIWRASEGQPLSGVVQKVEAEVENVAVAWNQWESIRALGDKVYFSNPKASSELPSLGFLLSSPYIRPPKIHSDGCFASSALQFIYGESTLQEDGFLSIESRESDLSVETEKILERYEEEKKRHIQRIQGPLIELIKKQLDVNLMQETLSVSLDDDYGWNGWKVVLGDNRASCSLRLPSKISRPEREEAAEWAYERGVRRPIEELRCQASGGSVEELRQRWRVEDADRFFKKHDVERLEEGIELDGQWESAWNGQREVRLFYRLEPGVCYIYSYSPSLEGWKENKMQFDSQIAGSDFNKILSDINSKWLDHFNSLQTLFEVIEDYPFVKQGSREYQNYMDELANPGNAPPRIHRRSLYDMVKMDGMIIEKAPWFLGREGHSFAHQLTWANPFTQALETTRLPPLPIEAMTRFCYELASLSSFRKKLKQVGVPYLWRTESDSPKGPQKGGFDGVSVGLDASSSFYYSVQFCGEQIRYRSSQDAIVGWKLLSGNLGRVSRYFLTTSYAAPELVLPDPTFSAKSVKEELIRLRLQAANIEELLKVLGPKSRWALFTHLSVAFLNQSADQEKQGSWIELEGALSSVMPSSWNGQNGEWDEDLGGRDEKLVELYCTRCLKPPAELLSFWDGYFRGMGHDEHRHGKDGEKLTSYRGLLEKLIAGNDWRSAVPTGDRTKMASKIKIVLATLSFKAHQASSLTDKSSLIGQLISLAEVLEYCEAAWATAVMELHETVDPASNKSALELYLLREGDQLKRVLLTKLATGDQYRNSPQQSQHIYLYLVKRLGEKGYSLPAAAFHFDDNHGHLGRRRGLTTPEEIEAAFIAALTPQQLLTWFYPIVNQLLTQYNRLTDENNPQERERIALLYHAIEDLLMQSATEKLLGVTQRIGLESIKNHWTESQTRRENRSAIETRYEVVRWLLEKLRFCTKESACYNDLMAKLGSTNEAIQQDHGAILDAKLDGKRKALIDQLGAFKGDGAEELLNDLLAQLANHCDLDVAAALNKALLSEGEQPAVEQAAELKEQLELLAGQISHYHALSNGYALHFVEWMEEHKSAAEEKLLSAIREADGSLDDEAARRKISRLQRLWHQGAAAFGGNELQSWQGDEKQWMESYHRDGFPTETSLLTDVEKAVAKELDDNDRSCATRMQTVQQKEYLIPMMEQAYFVMEEDPVSYEERRVAIRRQGLVALLQKLHFLS